jgi:DNA repair exonuclease SbcCD ATPase subunit
MATAASLTVDLRLLTAAFEAGSKKAVEETRRMRESFEDLKGGLESVTGVLEKVGIALGVKEMIDFGLESLRAAGELTNLAQQVGVSTDALQELQFAARQSGVSAEEMETSVAHLTRTIGEAASGNEAAISAFNRLGVGVLDAQGKIRSTESVLGDVADALEKIPDPAARAAAETDLFGRAGQRLDPILAGGRERMREFNAEAQNSGQVLSQDVIKQAQEATDRIDAMESAWSKLAQTLIAKVAPALTRIAELLTPQATTVADQIKSLEENIARLEALPEYDKTQDIKDTLAALRDQLSDYLELQRQLQNMGGYSAPGGTSNPAIPGKTDAAGGARASRAQDAADIRDETSALQEYLLTLQQEQRELTLTSQQRAEYEALIRASAAAQRDYDAGLRESPLLTGEEAAAIKANADKLYEMKQAAEESNAALVSTSDIATEKTTDLTSSFSSLNQEVAAGITGAQTWGQVWQSVLEDVIKLLFQMLEAGAGVGKGGDGGILGSIFGSLLGAIGLGGGGGGIGAPTRFGGVFAAGGRPPVGVPSLVGEQGPELFVPDAAGTVIPNGFGGLGGMVLYQTNHYDLRGTDISRAELDHKLKKSQRETYGAVFKAIGAGGNESKSVGRRRK